MRNDANNAFSYFHINCRGQSAKWESFRELLCELKSDNFCFDYIEVSEVFKCDDDHRLKLPGFHDILTQCRIDGVRGGIGLLIKVRHSLSLLIPHSYEYLFIEIISISVNNSTVEVIYHINTPPRSNIDIFQHIYLILLT